VKAARNARSGEMMFLVFSGGTEGCVCSVAAEVGVSTRDPPRRWLGSPRRHPRSAARITTSNSTFRHSQIRIEL